MIIDDYYCVGFRNIQKLVAPNEPEELHLLLEAVHWAATIHHLQEGKQHNISLVLAIRAAGRSLNV